MKVVLYESGEGPVFVYGPGAWDVVLRLANGENVFADGEDSYLELSVEEVATQDVDMFMVVDYNDGMTEQKVEFLEQANFTVEHSGWLPRVNHVLGTTERNQRHIVVAKKILMMFDLERLSMKYFVCLFVIIPSLAFAQYPVTVENCGNTLTFDKTPERVVTTYSVTSELMLRLGLENAIVGAAAFGEPMPSDLQDAYENLNLIGSDYLIPKEIMLSLEPDFVIDNEPATSDGSKGNATREELTAVGAQIYTLTAKCEGATEVKLGAKPLNRMSALGLPDSYKVLA